MLLFDLEQQRRKRFLINRQKSFREHCDFYEYCLVYGYEKKFSGCENSAIQLKNVFASVVESDGSLHLVAIQFPKSCFNLQEAAAWLQDYGITAVKAGTSLRDAEAVIEGVLFKGIPLLLYRKGKGKIEFCSAELVEVTENFTVETQEIYTSRLRQIDPGKYLDIIYNGERLSTVPKLEFTPEKDIIISNGNLVLADRLDRFGDSVAFFRRGDRKTPVAIVLDHGKTVHISVSEHDDGSRICRVSVE